MLNCSLLRLREGVLAQARENRIACCICFRRPNVISSFYKEALNGKPQWFLRGPSAFKCRLVWVFPVAEWIRRGFGGRTATSSQQTSFWLVFTRRKNSRRGFGMLVVVAVPHTVQESSCKWVPGTRALWTEGPNWKHQLAERLAHQSTRRNVELRFSILPNTFC